MGGISVWQLIIIAIIVALLFGTNKLRSLGSDLGASIKGFKKSMSDDTSTPSTDKSSTDADNTTNDADFTAKTIADSPPDVKTEKSKNDKEQV
ncbi:twin-arginine translocase TatA/TatE family subunit [Candidatus Fukatsuia symbiotica]|uniref:Sec-independent protein translocase protein TatA n=1 Tax=Candidatus Fukatsuia symbiotica TaxID=1878942 RepID=A0A2U8I944_9GAMM|nr:twin-arginine translocase TatA/TatE family subunit [Candidatus Fukatsuia symbiotica]AWK14595.1 twin-arginine translocase TatA/TatE family subunit [Candidatus Fukatsuia symbiotica]MEA9444895.1 twin-arginine translocase TatA/TatE family subunit [Candidatus Fukatsuia symbiotica]